MWFDIDLQVYRGKPAPDIYTVAAKRLRLEPTQCLAFEDALTGVQSAKAAGMSVIAIPDPRLDPHSFREAGADVVLASLRDWNPASVRFQAAPSTMKS